MTEPEPQSDRMRVRRLPELASYDRAFAYELLDRAYLAHIGVIDDDQPLVIPTLYARVDDELVLHGSVASRLMRHGRGGLPICVTVTEVDGLVLARSAFETSMNYRSVVVVGTARMLDDPDRRLEALRAISENVLPGRWDDVRPPSDVELRQTMVVAVTIDEFSVKVRTGPPDDEPDDVALPVWAGEAPIRRVASELTPAPDLAAGIAVPGYLQEWVDEHD